jgi:hypothetical protein
MQKFLYPIALPTNPIDPSGSFDEGSIYYDSSLKAIKHYSLNSWQFLPNFSSLSGVPTPLLTTGLRVCPYVNANTGTTAIQMVNGYSFWIPFSVNRKTIISAISIRVITGAENSSQNVGIYNSNPTNLYPSTLLGSVILSTTFTALVTETLTTAITLTPGVYWIAIASTGHPMLAALNPNALLPLAYLGTTPTPVTNYRNYTGTTLPSTAPTTGYTAETGAFPLVLLTINL